MDNFLEILRQFLPLEIAIIAIIFFYLLILFWRLAKEHLEISKSQTSLIERQANLAEKQTTYISQRLEVLESFTGIADKTVELRDKHISYLEKENANTLESFNDANKRVEELSKELEETISDLNLKDEQVYQLEKALTLLQTADQEKFKAIVRHEQGGYLAVVRATIDRLNQKYESLSQDEIKSYLKSLEQITEVGMLTHRTNFDNFDKESFYRFEETDVNVQIMQIVQLIEQYYGREISFEKQQVPPIAISRQEFRIAIFNLIDNAVKYSRGDFPITVTSESSEKTYRFAVTNIGIRLSEEELNKDSIFMPGRRGKFSAVRSIQGSGLGLHVAKEIVARHDGKISVTSRPYDSKENITTFTIQLSL